MRDPSSFPATFFGCRHVTKCLGKVKGETADEAGSCPMGLGQAGGGTTCMIFKTFLLKIAESNTKIWP